MGKNLITSPFSNDVVTVVTTPGQTIVDILKEATVPYLIWDQVVITVNGIELHRDQWDILSVRENDSICVFVTQMGGDNGKTILRMVAIIAVSVFAAYAGGLAAQAGWGLAGQAVVTAGITIVGTLAVNALIPPPSLAVNSSGSAAGNSYFLSGQDNRARFYEIIPIVYGAHKMVANLASSVDVFNAGVSSIFSAVYDFGLGGAMLSQLKLGDTALDILNGQSRILKRVPELINPAQPALGMEAVDLKLIGYPIKYQDLSLGLNDINDEGISSTSTSCVTAVVEISYPRGLVKIDNSGYESYAQVSYEIAWRDHNGPTWYRPPVGSKVYAGRHLRASFGTGSRDRGPGDSYGDINSPGSVIEGFVDLDTEYVVNNGSDLNVIVEFKGYAWRVDDTNNAEFTLYDPDTDTVFTGGQIVGNLVSEINLARRYQFDVTFDPGFKGRLQVRVDSANFKPSSLANTPAFNSTLIHSNIIVVDMTEVTKPADGEPIPAPDAPPSGLPRYKTTAGSETHVEVLQKRPYPWIGDYTPDGNSINVIVEGVQQVASLSDTDSYKGEMVSVGTSWIDGNHQYRVAKYATKYQPKSVGVSDGIFFPVEPEPGNLVNSSKLTVSGNRADYGIISLVLPFSTPGYYDIKITRLTAQTTEPQLINGSVWSKLNSRGSRIEDDDRSILNLKKQHTLMELQFEANENISGNVQQISAIAHGEVRPHTGTAWLPAEITSNPAWIVLDILTGYSIQNHQDIPIDYLFDGGWIKDDQIDFASFVSLSQLCDETVYYDDLEGQKNRPRYTCNTILSTDAPLIETVQSILSMCRAQLIMGQDGRYSVLRDEIQTTPRQLFTPQNSWGFTGNRAFQEIPHAFFVEFTSPELGYQIGTTTVYRSGYNVENSSVFETLSTYGITNWHQASQYGMYMLAQGFVRSEIFNLNCDLENLVIQRGDMVHVQHDVPLLGGTACIVKQDSTGTVVTVDQQIGAFDPPRGFTLRHLDGTIISGTIDSIVGDQINMLLPIDVNQGEVIVVGTEKASGLVTDPYIVTGITPKVNLQAEITLVKYDEDVYRTDWGFFPIWDPSFGMSPGEETRLYIENLAARAGFATVNRAPISKTLLTWDLFPTSSTPSCKFLLISFRDYSSGEASNLVQIDGTLRLWTHEYDSTDISFGRGWYTITPISNLGYLGQAQTISVGQVVDDGVPDAPVNVIAEYVFNTTTTTVRWDFNVEVDIEKYMVYSSAVDGGLSAADYLLSTPYNINYMTCLAGDAKFYYVVAVDTSGNYSEPTIALSVPSGGGDGLSIIVANAYIRKATKPNQPLEDDGQYDFDLQELTPPSKDGGSADDWFVNPPEGPDPLYVTSGTFSILGITGTDATVVWSDSDELVSDGNPGDRITIVNAYLRKPTAPALPVGDTLDEYNFTSLSLTPPSKDGGSADDWSARIPPGTDPLWVISATASAGYVDVVDETLVWTSPDLLTNDGAGFVPNFAPGFIGGQSDFVFTLNATIGGTPDDGEIRIQGGTLIKPNGVTELTAAVDFSIYTFYEATEIGRLYIMFSAVNAETRFGGVSGDWGIGDTRFCVITYDDENGWQARDDSGDYFPFTPLATDCIIARCDKTGTIGGLNSIQIMVAGLAGAVGTEGQSTRQVTVFRRNSPSINVNEGTFPDPLDGNPDWSYDVPGMSSNNDVIYSSTRIFTSDDAPPAQSQWSAPVISFTRKDGAIGQGTRNVTLFRKNSNLRNADLTTGTYLDPIGLNTPDWDYPLPVITDNADKIYSMTRVFTTDAAVPQEAEWSNVTLFMERVDGSDGENGRAVNITATDPTIEYDTDGRAPNPTGMVINAVAMNTFGTVFYEFLKNDISVKNTIEPHYNYIAPLSYTDMPEKMEVHIREGAAFGDILARDQLSILGLKAGVDAITIVMSNEAHSLSTTSAGVVDYFGSGVNIEVWEGTTQLPHDAVAAYDTPSFRVAVIASPNITPGAIANPQPSAYVWEYEDHTAMLADVASITYEITVVTSTGVEIVFNKKQSFAKSTDGLDGADGTDGLNGAPGLDGTDGIPGADGVDGQTSYFHVAYADSITGTGFSQSPLNKDYIGTYVDYTQLDSVIPGDYTWALYVGLDGENGIPGVDGATGQTTYLHIAYATNSTGSTGFHLSDPTGRSYIGQYTDFIAADSSNYTYYTWSKYVGESPFYFVMTMSGANTLAWSKDAAGVWSPTGLTTWYLGTVYQDGVALNDGSPVYQQVSATINSVTGLFTYGITAGHHADVVPTITGSGTQAMTITWEYKPSGGAVVASMSQTVTSVMASAGGGGGLIDLEGRYISTSAIEPINPYSYFRIDTDGYLYYDNSSTIGHSYQQWLATGESASDYEVKATVIGDTSPSSSSGTGSWLALTADKYWIRNDTVTGSDPVADAEVCVLEIKVRHKTTLIGDICTVTLKAQKNSSA